MDKTVLAATATGLKEEGLKVLVRNGSIQSWKMLEGPGLSPSQQCCTDQKAELRKLRSARIRLAVLAHGGCVSLSTVLLAPGQGTSQVFSPAGRLS